VEEMKIRLEMVGIGIFFSLSFSPFVLSFFLPLLTHPSRRTHVTLTIRTKILTYRNRVIDKKKIDRIFRVVQRRANVKLRVRSNSDSSFTIFILKFLRDAIFVATNAFYNSLKCWYINFIRATVIFLELALDY